MTLRAALGESGAALRVLCFGAHSDDIEIGCGGTILRLLAEHPGSTVRWVVLSSSPERKSEALASAREFLTQAEQTEVAVRQFRDGYFPDQWAAIKDVFESTKPVARPDLILTHHRFDRHQDHRVVAELTWNTFRDHLILEYEIPKYEGDLGSPNLFVPLSEATARLKSDLIVRHFGSQGSRRWFRAETFEAVMRLRGVECNAPEGVAEAFHAAKVVI
jgi:LmbE family N-acetylglucosaminyl deacetylase